MTRAPEPPLDPLGESESRADADALRAAHARDAAIVLPVLGLLLFSPPLITLFASDAPVFGAPFIVVYLFAAWATLVAAALVLSRRLREGEAGEEGA